MAAADMGRPTIGHRAAARTRIIVMIAMVAVLTPVIGIESDVGPVIVALVAGIIIARPVITDVGCASCEQ